jgi:hypothetical protein
VEEEVDHSHQTQAGAAQHGQRDMVEQLLLLVPTIGDGYLLRNKLLSLFVQGIGYEMANFHKRQQVGC